MPLSLRSHFHNQRPENDSVELVYAKSDSKEMSVGIRPQLLPVARSGCTFTQRNSPVHWGIRLPGFVNINWQSNIPVNRGTSLCGNTRRNISIGIPLDLSIPTEMTSIEPLVENEKSSKTPKKLKIMFYLF